MGCASCNRNKKGTGYIHPEAIYYPPLNSTDLNVLSDGELRRLDSNDWPSNRNKVLLFFPLDYVNATNEEIQEGNSLHAEFDSSNTDVFFATSEPPQLVQDLLEAGELTRPVGKMLFTYILATRLNLIHNGKVKRSTVIIMKDGNLLIQDGFINQARSLAYVLQQIQQFEAGKNGSDAAR